MVKAENSPAIGPTLTLFSFLFMYHCNIKKRQQQAGVPLLHNFFRSCGTNKNSSIIATSPKEK
jgi:hypothetical protein